MLVRMGLAEQWSEIERGLPDSWSDARLALTVHDSGKLARALALLAPLNPGCSGDTIRFFTARRGAGFGPEHIRRLLKRLDSDGVRGKLTLVSSGVAEAEPEVARATLGAGWDALLVTLPADWSDLYVELELTSTDHLERGALLLAPVNPARYGGVAGFRFRVARKTGYGASPQMTRRCLERLDEVGIDGELRVIRVLCDTNTVYTQGPVWHVAGKTV
jgi:hypothetical protein